MNKLDTPINTREMVIQEVAIDSVTPYEKNPRKIPKEAVDKVAASIREFGFKQPIVVDKDMVIIVGHTRLMAAKKLGYEKVPVLVASDLSPEKARAYRLADNKTNELTDWDFDTLQEELSSFLLVDDRNNKSVIEDKVNLNDMNKQQLIEYIKELQHIQKLTVLREDKPTRSDLHPTMKPVKLIARLVGNSSRQGDIVLDLFGGSGTTLIVSEQMGRACRMMEFDPIYCQVIINRWEALTGRIARKIC